MDRKVFVMLFGILISGFILDGVECSIFSREEKQKYFPTTTAKTVYGETYDCFDIDKQPALLHPALIGHQVKISPGKKYVDAWTNNSFKHEDSDENVWLEERRCPFGTVPIPRRNRKHFGRVKYHYPKALNNSIKYDGGVEFAGITVSDGGLGYYGVRAYSSVYKLEVDSNSHQWTASSIIMEKGDNQIQAGWTVNPDLYHDGNTRFYTFWTRDNQRSTGCYNTDCPGFVVVSGKFPVNFVFEQVSEPGTGKRVEVKILIAQTEAAWWLVVNDNIVGYWVKALFTDLGETGSSARLGGQVYSPDDTTPPMGSGKYRGDNQERTAYMHKIEVFFKGGTSYGPPPSNLYQTVRSRCYFVGSDSYSSDPYQGFNFLYGGKGGINGITCI